jgi:DNA-binding transcriptional LysR family regulator
MDLDLRKVRYFVAVAEQLHFTRAAEELLIAQPVLSRQIRVLERELGAELFARESRGITLTKAGQQLLDDARPLLAAADAAQRRVERAARDSRSLSIGFRAGISVARDVRAFTAKSPDVSVVVRRVEWDDQADAVLDGRVDVAYVRLPVAERGLRLEPLYAEPRMVALPADHAWAQRSELTSSELAELTEIRHLCMGPSPDEPATGPAVRTVEEKLEYVASGHGITFLPTSAARFYTRPDVAYVPVTDLPPDQVCLAWDAASHSDVAAEFAVSVVDRSAQRR